MKTLKHMDIVAHVHDEPIIECDKRGSLSNVCDQMARTPPWAKGLLLRADGFECKFYSERIKRPFSPPAKATLQEVFFHDVAR